MTKDRFTIRAAVYLVLIQNNKILLSRRYNTGYQDGKYSMIAGHLDGNESPTKSMVREAKEEAGIRVEEKNLKLVHVIYIKTNAEYLDLFFQAEKWNGKPTIMEKNKCDDLSWFSLDNLPKNIIPEVKQAIENIQEEIIYSNFQ